MSEEIEDIKQEYKEWRESKNIIDKPVPWAVVMTQLHESDNKCVLEITAIPTGETKKVSDLKEWLHYALIKHFDDLLKDNVNPIYERIKANRKHEIFKEECNKKYKEEN